MSGDFQHMSVHATRPSTLHSNLSLIGGIATDGLVGRWGWVRLRLSPRRSDLSLVKERVYGTKQIGGAYRFREQLVNPNEICLGQGAEVHRRESNDLDVRAKLPYEPKRLVTVKSRHVVIEHYDADVTPGITEHVQSFWGRWRRQHIEATLAKQGFDGQQQRGVVINHQNGGFRFASVIGSAFRESFLLTDATVAK